MVNLEELSIKEFKPLDYSKFPRLKQLILTAGTDLAGLDRVGSLELLYLGLWNSDTLPQSIGAITATMVRISASKKLIGIQPLCSLVRLEGLMMQYLPALKVGQEINRLTSLKDLHVEKCGWIDFSPLRIDSLRVLFASKVESLRFIKQLKTSGFVLLGMRRRRHEAGAKSPQTEQNQLHARKEALFTRVVGTKATACSPAGRQSVSPC